MKSKKGKRKTIAVFGTGYVGIVTCATFLELGHDVICVDILDQKVKQINNGISPVYEPGVQRVLENGIRSKRLRATMDAVDAVKRSDFSFICVGTPSKANGAIDLRYIRSATKDIGKGLKNKKGYHVVVIKSTVIPTTTEGMVLPLLERASGKRQGTSFALACNPEFLKEGTALKDSLNPDRIVIGSMDDKTAKMVNDIYGRTKGARVFTDLSTAETIKYVSNAFLATKVALTNEVANICSASGVDVYKVMEGVGLDRRIGPLFLRAGAGFGGSCFPKDVEALIYHGKRMKAPLKVLPAVIEQNGVQPLQTVRMLKDVLKDLRGKTIALMGVAFKPDTDDIRETRALPILKALRKQGAKVHVFDPNETALNRFMDLARGKNITKAKSIKEALRGVHGAIFQTEWDEFKSLKPSLFLKLMKKPVIIDGRRTFDPEKFINASIIFRGIGWKNR